MGDALIAVDTNITVRWITRDDEEQADLADAIMRQPTLVPATVLLELVWVLGAKRFDLPRGDIARVLNNILAIDTIKVPFEACVQWAIGRYETGADFADMLHIACSPPAIGFATFDKRLVRRLGDDPPIPLEGH